MENLVTSKEVSEKLKKLGVKQESVFAYYGNAGEWSDAIVDMFMYQDADEDFREHKLLPAYLVTELGELLKPYMNDIEISARDDIFNPDFWGNYLISKLTEKQNG